MNILTKTKNRIKKPAQSTDDTRYFPRWQIKYRVTFCIGDDTKIYQANSRDLSCAGISLVTAAPLSPKHVYHMSIFFKKNKCLEVQGEPVWSRKDAKGYLTGVNFVNIDENFPENILKLAFEIPEMAEVAHRFSSLVAK